MHKKTLFLILLLVLIVAGFLLSRGTPHGPRETEVATFAPIVSLKNGDTYTLTAAPVTSMVNGKKFSMLAYNGSIPGPSIHVTEGDAITIHFTNNTHVPTLLHSHGVRMENRSDGSQLVGPELQPGESFDYHLNFTDPGIYWYHPHVREDKEQNMGLYGSFVVAPKDMNYWPPADGEEVLFLSDLLIEDGAIAPYSDQYITHALMGRFGNTLFINGTTSAVFFAQPGEVRRYFVVNAATTRPFHFRLVGATMKLIGGDNGRYEKETMVDGIILGPAERAIVDVYFPSEGSYAIENQTPAKTYTLGKVVVSGALVPGGRESFFALRTDTSHAKEYAFFRRQLARLPDKRLALSLSADMNTIMGYMGGGMNAMSSGMHMHDAVGNDIPMPSAMVMSTSSMQGLMSIASGTPPKIEWDDLMGAMNTYSTSDTVKWIMRDLDTGKENMDVVWKFKQGDLVKVRITNDLKVVHPMQHPIHFHGNRFVVLAINGVVNDNMAWKDTTFIQTGDTVDILLDAGNPGKWLVHCHIAEHMHSGMMLEYDVE